MPIMACDLPAGTALDPDMLAHADFRDAFSVRLSQPGRPPAALFVAIFGHRPWWMKMVLIARHAIGSAFGLASSRPSDILSVTAGANPGQGGSIGGWPLFWLDEQELVAGRDNRHMDFRLSLMTIDRATGQDLVVSTLCRTHNRFGRLYLAAIIPFHRWGLRLLVRRARAAGRL